MASITIESTLWQLLRAALRAGKPLRVAELRTMRRNPDKYLHLERALIMGLFEAQPVPPTTFLDDVPIVLTHAGRRTAEYGEVEVDSATFAGLDAVRSEKDHKRLAARLGALPPPLPDSYTGRGRSGRSTDPGLRIPITSSPQPSPPRRKPGRKVKKTKKTKKA